MPGTGHAVMLDTGWLAAAQAIAEWLEDHGGDIDQATPLAETAVTVESLEKLASVMSGECLEDSLRWLSACCAVRQASNELQESTRRISELVASVKGFTYMGRATVPEPVNVGRGLKDTARIVASKARDKNVTLKLEVDPDSYEARLSRFTSVVEIGKAIHPVLAAGQVEGGVAQGIGYALMEEEILREGRMANASLTNYLIPTSVDTPTIDTVILERPYRHGPFGAKGVGEIPMDGPAPAIVNAMRSLGIDVRQRLQAGPLIGASILEVIRIKRAPPAVAAGHELDAELARHDVERQPNRAHLEAVDGPVRLVLMPGSPLPRARLFHQQVIIKEVDFGGIHHRAGDRCCRRFEDEAPKSFNPPPEIEIAEETARATFPGVSFRVRAGVHERLFDGVAQQFDPGA